MSILLRSMQLQYSIDTNYACGSIKDKTSSHYLPYMFQQQTNEDKSVCHNSKYIVNKAPAMRI